MAIKTFKYFDAGVGFKDQAADNITTNGVIYRNGTKLKAYIENAARELVTTSQTQTLTNKTIDADLSTISNLEVDNLKVGVLDTDLTSVSALHDTIPSAKATKDYVDAQVLTKDAASEIAFTPAGTIVATNVQAALEEVSQDHTDHVSDTTDAHDASAISNVPTGNLIATDVQTALNELQSDVDSRVSATELNNHINDTTDAHDASAISSVASGNLAATDVQTALNELQSDIDLRALTTNGSIITPTRLDFKQDTYANLVTYASTASDGQAVYATDTDEYYGIKANALVSFGGGSSGLDTIFQLNATELIATWSTGDNATFLGGGTLAGTFAYNTSTPLHGTSSYKYTQAAGSLNDYIASATQAVDLRFRGQQTFLTFPFKYDGSTSDIQIVIYDATNSAIISSSTDVVIGTGTSINTAIVGVIIPLTCASIRIGFHVKVLNSGKILEFDDVQLSLSLYQSARLNGDLVYTAKVSSASVLSDESSSFIQSITNANPAVITFKPGIFTVTPNITISVNGVTNRFLTATSLSTTSVSINQYDDTGTPTRAGFVIACHKQGVDYSGSQSPAVIVPSQQVSSDTMSFAFKATAIDPATDAIGTFNTYTYAAGGTLSISASAPTQTVADMNVNGMFLTARAGGATSTTASPAHFRVFIGKGLKSQKIDAYAATAKLSAFNYDMMYNSGATAYSGIQTSYNESTGILVLDGGYTGIGSGSARTLGSDIVNGSGPTTAYLTFNASKSPSLVTIPNLQQRVAYLSDVKANNTQGGSAASAAYQTRVLNTLVDNTGIVTSLVSNQFTLPAGTYDIEAIAPALIVNNHRIRIRNITDSTTPILGKSSHSNGTNGSQTDSTASGEITITSSKVFELQHYTGTARATDGLGMGTGTGENEVYGQVKIVRIK